MNEVKTKEELVRKSNQPQKGIKLSVINHKINVLNKRIKDVDSKLSDWYEDYEYMYSTHSSHLGFNQISSDMIDERIQIEEELNSLSDEKSELLRIKKDKEMNDVFRICSYSEGWSKHNNHQLHMRIKSLQSKLFGYKGRIRELEVSLKNRNKGCKGLLVRNKDLEYRLNYEKRVVKSLKQKLKKFEENNGGGEN